MLTYVDMLKAFDNIELSKSMYIKHKNMIITASRGRRIKVKTTVTIVLGNTIELERRYG